MANYLYNGEGPLPDVNGVWTDEVKAELPYAFIEHTSLGHYLLRCFSNIVHFTGDTYEGYPKLETMETSNKYRLENNSWVLVSSDSSITIVIANGNEIVWSNYSILNEDGSVYLAASDPVPVNPINPSVLLSAFFAGQALRRMRGRTAEKTLVGYLYNGVGPLPDINSVWTDKTNTYPYAVIAYNTSISCYTLSISSRKKYYDEANVALICIDSSERWQLYKYDDTNSKWSLLNSGTTTSMTYAQPIWASYDVLHCDWVNGEGYVSLGTVYLATSEPVPVYE